MLSYEEIINYETKNKKNGVLNNNLNINDQDELNRAERLITSYRLAEMFLDNNNLEFTVDYYLKIHEYLFKDIYPFAGQIMDEIIEKRIPFCLPHLIYFNLNKLLLKAEKLSQKINDENQLIDIITYVYSELDIIHPFLEGNGRTEREFIRQYVDYINNFINFGKYKVDYTLIENDKDGFIEAVVAADALCDLTKLREYMKSIIVNEKILTK